MSRGVAVLGIVGVLGVLFGAIWWCIYRGPRTTNPYHHIGSRNTP